MTLQNLIQNNQIEQIISTPTDAKIQIDKSKQILNFVMKTKDIPDSEEVIYNQLYDSQRIACMALLTLNGYRAKGSGHHKTTIEAAKFILVGQLQHEFRRLQKMRSGRIDFNYGGFVVISKTQIAQTILDANAIINTIDGLIASNNSTLQI